jgi:hypothetical protein
MVSRIYIVMFDDALTNRKARVYFVSFTEGRHYILKDGRRETRVADVHFIHARIQVRRLLQTFRMG